MGGRRVPVGSRRRWNARLWICDAQIGLLRQKGRDEIRAILTPEQKPKFEEFLRKLDEERKRNASK